jgi:hypothetical protein
MWLSSDAAISGFGTKRTHGASRRTQCRRYRQIATGESRLTILFPRSYCTLTKVRSRNHDCGEMNPLTFGDIARGLRSWTM